MHGICEFDCVEAGGEIGLADGILKVVSHSTFMVGRGCLGINEEPMAWVV